MSRPVKKRSPNHDKNPTLRPFVWEKGLWQPGNWNPEAPDLPDDPENFLPLLEDIFSRYRNTPVLRQVIRAMLEWFDARTPEWRADHALLGNELAFNLVRYEFMARNYADAARAMQRAPTYAPMRPIWARLNPRCLRSPGSPPAFWASGGIGKDDLDGLPSLRSRFSRYTPEFIQRLVQPQESYPENYYTYLYSEADETFAETLLLTLSGQEPVDTTVDVSYNFDPDDPGYPPEVQETLEDVEEVLLATEAYVNDLNGATDEIVNTAVHLQYLAFRCWDRWNKGIRYYAKGRYLQAMRTFSDCQEAILSYLEVRFPDEYPDDVSNDATYYDILLPIAEDIIWNQFWTQGVYEFNYPYINAFFSERSRRLTLESLYAQDWIKPKEGAGAAETDINDTSTRPPFDLYASNTGMATAFYNYYTIKAAGSPDPTAEEESKLSEVEFKVDGPLLALALVFVPMAIADTAYKLRDPENAISECEAMLSANDGTHEAVTQPLYILNTLIEDPYVRILRANALMLRGDQEYKSEELAEDEAVDEDPTLKAVDTYEEVLAAIDELGKYVADVEEAVAAQRQYTQDLLDDHMFAAPARKARLNAGEEAPAPLLRLHERKVFEAKVKGTSIPGMYFEPKWVWGHGMAGREHIVTIDPVDNTQTNAETNPVVYALACEAEARLLQIEAGLNWLGYREDYVPPWRFQFLLTSARYYAEQAKAGQARYISFLYSAENEEFQEMSAAQAVEVESANVRTATAKVEQAQLEVVAAQESLELANMTTDNAVDRQTNYGQFDQWADAAALANLGVALIEVAVNPTAIVTTAANEFVADQQRELEKQNLAMAQEEAQQAAVVAAAQVDVAAAALTVATLEKNAAVLKREYAIQNLEYLENRTLNAEMWFRLADSIRGIADRYMWYATQQAFMAEQAYEFEADKRVNVIRFDYDQNSDSALLSADFLLADLDTLEHDKITSQQERQQQVRYVLSMARECPQALEYLRQDGYTTFSLTLEQLERRFPGLYNLRIGSVEIAPVALMDSTRISIELTHQGTSVHRSKNLLPSTDLSESQLGESEEPVTELPYYTWTQAYDPNIDPGFPPVIHVWEPETAIYSGLTNPGSNAAFSYMVANQLGAFEQKGAAASWYLDISRGDNPIDPLTLADVLITFEIFGFFDPTLRDELEALPRPTPVPTRNFSALRVFPDAFYEFNDTGEMVWNITRDLLVPRPRSPECISGNAMWLCSGGHDLLECSLEC